MVAPPCKKSKETRGQKATASSCWRGGEKNLQSAEADGMTCGEEACFTLPKRDAQEEGWPNVSLKTEEDG